MLSPPLGYLAFLGLEAEARFVLTDSGGVQEETSALGVRCFTLRDSTERPVTVELGTNTVLGARPDRIAEIPSLLEQERPRTRRSRSGTARQGLVRRRRCCALGANRRACGGRRQGSTLPPVATKEAAGPTGAQMSGVHAGAIVLVGVMALNLGNYVFHVVSARWLGPELYGDLATLIAIAG